MTTPTLVTSQEVQAGSGSPITVNVTTTSGNCLIVKYNMPAFGDSIDSVKFGTTTGTLVTSHAGGGGADQTCGTWLWTGVGGLNAAVVVTPHSGAGNNQALIIEEWANVNQTTPYNTTNVLLANGGGTAGISTNTISGVTAGNVVTDSIHNNGYTSAQTWTQGTGKTLIQGVSSTGVASQYVVSSGTVRMDWTWTAPVIGFQTILELNASSGGGSNFVIKAQEFYSRMMRG